MRASVKPNVLERARCTRSGRKEAAPNCHQVHSVDTLLTAESKAYWQNMCSYKSLVILLLLLAVSVGQRNSYMPCKPLPCDTLLRRESSARSFKFLKRVSATESFSVGNNIITCVLALDQWSDGTGGSAEFVGGGIGYNYVHVKITSKVNRGFWFVIEVYGQPRCKYLRKSCVNFRTCLHTHLNCRYTTFYPKILSGLKLLKYVLISPNCFCGLVIGKHEYMYIHRHIRT